MFLRIYCQSTLILPIKIYSLKLGVQVQRNCALQRNYKNMSVLVSLSDAYGQESIIKNIMDS